MTIPVRSAYALPLDRSTHADTPEMETGHYPATTFPTEFNGTGNVYSLNPAKVPRMTTSDFQIHPYYTTYFFIDPEKAMALGLKGQRI